MRKEFSATYSKNIEDNNDSTMLHYYHIDIYNKSQKLYKLMVKGKKLELIFKKELNKQQFKPDDKYHVVLVSSEVITAFYR